MPRGGIGQLGDLRAVQATAHAIERVLGLSLGHERGVHGKATNASTEQVADGVRDIERNGVVDMPAATQVRRHGEAIALAVLEKARRGTALARSATLVTGALRHEETMGSLTMSSWDPMTMTPRGRGDSSASSFI